MAWDLDDLEEDEEYGEMPEALRMHLDSTGCSSDMSPAAPGDADFNLAQAGCNQDYTEPEPSPRASSIIFLNVDGVLHPLDADVVLADGPLSQLRRVVDASGARIVLSSSSWRLADASKLRLDSALKDAGIYTMIGTTPDLERREGAEDLDVAELRAAEIQSWLEEHESLVDPESWIVIDTELVDTETDDGVNHTVQTDPSTGLNAATADVAIAKLMASREQNSEICMVGEGTGGY